MNPTEPKHHPHRHDRDAQPSSGHAVQHEIAHADAADAIDAVCGMKVKPTTQHRWTHEGHEYLFCNPRCVEKFKASPQAY